MYTADSISVTESRCLLHAHMYTLMIPRFMVPAGLLHTVDDFSSKISECVSVLFSCRMKSNRLPLNCDKTEVLRCASSRRQHQLPPSALSIDGTLVEPVKSARDPGVDVVRDLLMWTYVQRTVSSCFAVLRQLRQFAAQCRQTCSGRWLSVWY